MKQSLEDFLNNFWIIQGIISWELYSITPGEMPINNSWRKVMETACTELWSNSNKIYCKNTWKGIWVSAGRIHRWISVKICDGIFENKNAKISGEIPSRVSEIISAWNCKWNPLALYFLEESLEKPIKYTLED